MNTGGIIWFNRWWILQLANLLLVGVRQRHLAADFPRRHELRRRWFNLLDKADLRPFVVSDIVGLNIYFEEVTK